MHISPQLNLIPSGITNPNICELQYNLFPQAEKQASKNSHTKLELNQSNTKIGNLTFRSLRASYPLTKQVGKSKGLSKPNPDSS